MEDFKLIKPTYKNAKGETVEAECFYVEFRDHNNGRQKLRGYPNKRDTERLCERVAELVTKRRNADPIDGNLRRWFDGLDTRTAERLAEIGLVDTRAVDIEKPLDDLLHGKKDATGTVIEPGYRQALEARGNSDKHCKVTTSRVNRVLVACGFIQWRDLARPGAALAIQVYLGKLREGKIEKEKKINGKSYSYHVRDVKGFAAWLAKAGLAPSNPLINLEAVDNEEMDSDQRRSLSTDEMRLLLDATESGPVREGITGKERAILYRFAFETAIRPSQIKSLTVAAFDLDSDTPTVQTSARYVKRRRNHTQVIRPTLAAELKTWFANKMPHAPAFKMPRRAAEIFREDLKVARDKWTNDAKDNAKEQQQRLRSDFLADVNHQGEKAVFYSLRHGHGTALAAAGVAEKDIAMSMHHASRTTTTRYLHGDRKVIASALVGMPDFSPQKQIATGTHSGTVDAVATFPQPFPITPRTSVTIGQSDQSAVMSGTSENAGNTGFSANSGDIDQDGLLAELADAVDSKSTALTGVPVRLR